MRTSKKIFVSVLVALLVGSLCGGFILSAEEEPIPGEYNAITDVPGIKVGHYTAKNLTEGFLTGTTVVLPAEGTTGG